MTYLGLIEQYLAELDSLLGGLARDLLEELEDCARPLGMQRLLLDTASPLEAARHWYLSSGCAEVPAYNDNPYTARWFAKRL